VVMSPAGLGPENELRWRGPTAIINDRPILSLVKMLHKDYDCKFSFQRKILAVSLKWLGAKMK
jgi:hypothetical protein